MDESVQKTGRAITVHEAQLNLGLGAELAAIHRAVLLPWKRRCCGSLASTFRIRRAGRGGIFLILIKVLVLSFA